MTTTVTMQKATAKPLPTNQTTKASFLTHTPQTATQSTTTQTMTATQSTTSQTMTATLPPTTHTTKAKACLSASKESLAITEALYFLELMTPGTATKTP